MLSEIYYVLRSRFDGQYLAARFPDNEQEKEVRYLLIFRENFEALSYLNTHGANVSDRFAVESVSSIQLKGILQRWGYQGVGVVEDPLLPRVQFLTYN